MTADVAPRVDDLPALERWVASTDIPDLADALARMSRDERMVPFRLLPRDRSLAVFETLDPVHQQEVLEGLRASAHRDLIESLPPDDRARLIGELPAKVATRALAGLSARAREQTAALLGYPPESVGRRMSTEYVSLRRAMTVGDALAKVRAQGHDAETVYTLPVTDDERHLEGTVSLRRLVLNDPGERVADLMDASALRVAADEDQEAAARIVQERDLLALPVIDSEDRLVGILTVDDAMEVLEAEVTEDQALGAATQPLRRPYLATSVPGLARSRGPWLVFLILAAGVTVNVLQHFEPMLETVVTLALFIPLLTATGGNTGAQASTVVIRAMAVDEVRFGDLPRVVWREVRVGLLLGIALGVAASVPVALLFESDIALVVVITLVTICTWATLVGSSLPLLARRLGLDPAVMSAPLVTTLVDATGLVIYFLVARTILGL